MRVRRRFPDLGGSSRHSQSCQILGRLRMPLSQQQSIRRRKEHRPEAGAHLPLLNAKFSKPQSTLAHCVRTLGRSLGHSSRSVIDYPKSTSDISGRHGAIGLQNISSPTDNCCGRLTTLRKSRSEPAPNRLDPRASPSTFPSAAM